LAVQLSVCIQHSVEQETVLVPVHLKLCFACFRARMRIMVRVLNFPVRIWNESSVFAEQTFQCQKGAIVTEDIAAKSYSGIFSKDVNKCLRTDIFI
jgi:hypothetical protein